MNAYLNLYMSNPTAGGTDGTAISLGDTETAPLSVTLDASTNEAKILKVAIRCESGFQTVGNTTIGFTGTSAAKWSIAADSSYADATAAAAATYSSTLTISSAIGTTNTIFWVKASSSSDETPGSDTSVNITVSAMVAPTA